MGLPLCSSLLTDVRPVLNPACHWNACSRLKLWSLKACWIIVRVSVALFPRLAQNLMHIRCSFLWSIVKMPQVTYTTPNKCVWKLPMTTQLRATWHTDSLDMVVLPSTVVSRYHNCSIDGSTSPENCGYHLVGSRVELTISSQKQWQIAENSTNVLVWLRDLNALSFTLNAVFSAVILFLNKIVLWQIRQNNVM